MPSTHLVSFPGASRHSGVCFENDPSLQGAGSPSVTAQTRQQAPTADNQRCSKRNTGLFATSTYEDTVLLSRHYIKYQILVHNVSSRLIVVRGKTPGWSGPQRRILLYAKNNLLVETFGERSVRVKRSVYNLQLQGA